MANTVTRIKEYIDYKGISIRKFEESVGFSNGSFASQYKNNKTIGVDKVEYILQTYPDINPSWLLTGTGKMLNSQLKPAMSIPQNAVPIYDRFDAAGIMTLGLDNIQPQEYVSIPDVKADGAVRMWGDMMYPEIKGGDLVLFKLIKNTNLKKSIFFGGLYLLAFEIEEDEHIVVCYIVKSQNESEVKLQTTNTQYPPKDIPYDSIKAIARVGVVANYKPYM